MGDINAARGGTPGRALDDARQRRQLALDLPPNSPKLGRAAYIVTEGNRRDIATLDAWLASEEPALLICGPTSSGKTHLLSIIVEDLRAEAFRTVEDAYASVFRGPGEARGAITVDDIDQLERPEKLLELLVACREQGRRMAFAGRNGPTSWAGGVVDLSTRLEAAPRLSASPPDEDLIRQVMTKLFVDRQIAVPLATVEFAARRLPRRLEEVALFVAAVDRASAEMAGPVSTKLAARILEELGVKD